MTLLVVLGIMLLAFLGSPLFIIAALITLIGFYLSDTSAVAIIAEMYRMANAPGLLAIPLFTFAGTILAEGKTPQRLVNLSNALFVLCIVVRSIFSGALYFLNARADE